jgi:hypothetical protein
MPEPPDFDFYQLANEMTARLYETVDGVARPRTTGQTILMTRDWYVEQLRLVWNARGAADLATIEAALAVQPPSILDQLRRLDR